jgi:hypothetical protein
LRWAVCGGSSFPHRTVHWPTADIAAHFTFNARVVLSHANAMIDLSVVDLSRLQFALTALYHFLFVPLTLGLSVLLAIMESVDVMTGLAIWRQMTKFWGLLFGINFAMGIALASRWSSSSAPTGPTSHTTSAISSAHRWRSKV